MNKGEKSVKWIKGQRISWLGHLVRMEEDRMPKKIFTQDLEGTRRGRPSKRWKEEVERDLKVLRVRRWRELVADRKKWKDFVRQAKAQQWAVMPLEEEDYIYIYIYIYISHTVECVVQVACADLHCIMCRSALRRT